MDEVVFAQECIAELYPFTEAELAFFKKELNFKYISANQKITWTHNLLKEFKEEWDYELINMNKAIFSIVTLGLLFPTKIELPECNCFRQDDFCENAQCRINARRLQYTSNLRIKNSTTYFSIAILSDTGLIKEDLLFDLFKNESIISLQKLIYSSFLDS
ncbi:hypothetical protein [Maribacter stanieri]|uniref:hypothetical protein n=1 Tax=Maribacter stanieri TaxID=440514 RepID=UPI002495988D|nr:hypothetical protein [Maribacter stanieri]